MFKKENNLGLILTIIICTVLISGSILFLAFQMSKSGTNQTSDTTGRAENIKSFVSGIEADTKIDDAVLGDKDAPVTIIEYSDYQCPFCRKYFEESYQQIKKDFVDTGKAKIIFRDYPLDFHEDAMFAANAAECAREQTDDETYFAFHDEIFLAQGPAMNGTVAITDKMIEKIAKDFDLNKKQFNQCLDDKKYYSEIAADFLAGDKDGVQGTPTLIINGEVVVGAQPYETFKSVIESKLQQ